MIEYKKEFSQKELDVMVEIRAREKDIKKVQNTWIIGLLVIDAGCTLYSILVEGKWGAVIAAIALGIFIYYRVPITMKNSIRKTYEKMNPRIFNGFRQYRIDESGIDTISCSGNSHKAWDAIACCGEQGDFIWMKDIGNSVFLLDKTILSKNDISELHRLFSAHNIPY